ncbi:acetyl-CoA carboxylase biotin carboxyl carrier protein [Butyrivibrio sp. Su6]|uniref:acetyl-CoA carboxylase biotin carboxyl carrier protein n=1 Tax=Butyrivibrio sp. Su6 TaxID=1520810 RepID=UPI00089E24D4|nr:acetyl-CoA carboxylase biotin carboxyl carrier protein subunit [Butyrivibrio sp. Su6]SEG38350.1 acetyl-CoA carboxylase biotin carboxyl carrier protein [Butyrivibrio sp. Su6]
MTNSLKDYEDMFARLSLSELEVHEKDFFLKLKRDLKSSEIVEKEPVANKNEVKNEPEAGEAKAVSGFEVKAPLLGVFNGSVGDKKALKKGDRVSKGDVLCTLEAMKMLNEVKSPVDGTMAKVLANEGDLVEYDQVLFVIE